MAFQPIRQAPVNKRILFRMYRLIRLIVGVVLPVVCALTGHLPASSSGVDLSQWLVEVRQADKDVGYFAAMGNVESRMNFLPALDFQEEDQRPRNLRSVKIEAHPQAEMVALTVFVAKEPEILEIPEDGWQQIRSLLLGPGQTVLLRELESFGLAPVRLRLVPKQPDEPSGLEFVNEIPEIEVVNWEESRHQVLLTLLNRSTRNVHALHFDHWDGGSNASSSGNIGTLEFPALAAGEEKVYRFAIPRRRGQKIEEWKIALSSIVFEDGSYYGEALGASRILAERYGKRVLQENLCSYLEKRPSLTQGETPYQGLQSLAQDFQVLGENTSFQLEDFFEQFPEFRDLETAEYERHIRQGIQRQAESAVSFILQTSSGTPLEESLSNYPQMAQHLFESLQQQCGID